MIDMEKITQRINNLSEQEKAYLRHKAKSIVDSITPEQVTMAKETIEKTKNK